MRLGGMRGDARAVGREHPDESRRDHARGEPRHVLEPDPVEHEAAEEGAESDRGVERRRHDRPREVADARRRPVQRARLEERGESTEGGAPQHHRDDRGHEPVAEERGTRDEHDEPGDHEVEREPREAVAEDAREQQPARAGDSVEEQEEAHVIGRDPADADRPRRDVRVEEVVPRGDEHDGDRDDAHRDEGAVAHIPDGSRLGRDGLHLGRLRTAMLDRRQEDHGQDGEADDEHRHRDERPAPADDIADGRRERHAQDEGERSAAGRDRDGPRELGRLHHERDVRSRHRPEEAVRETAEHARAGEHLVGRGDGGEHIGDREDPEHRDEQPLAREATREERERRGAQDDGEGEDRDQQADARLGDAEVRRDVGEQTGGEELARDRDEDRAREDEETEEREALAGSGGHGAEAFERSGHVTPAARARGLPYSPSTIPARGARVTAAT